jgi:hypothetical protein
MGGKSSNRARRRCSRPDAVDIDKLLDPMRAEIAKLNQEYLKRAQESCSKKRKVRKVRVAHKKGQGTLRSYGT